MTAPNIEFPHIGVRTMVIDAPPDSQAAGRMREHGEVTMFGMVWRPRFITEAQSGRHVWELRALREAT